MLILDQWMMMRCHTTQPACSMNVTSALDGAGYELRDDSGRRHEQGDATNDVDDQRCAADINVLVQWIIGCEITQRDVSCDDV
jgi:hypothetical protein